MKTRGIFQFVFIWLIPCILLAFWFVGSLVFNNQVSFSVLTHLQDISAIQSSTDSFLYKSQKIKGQFTASEDHVGLVILGFEQFVKPEYASEDVLVFRIREFGSTGWLHEYTVRSGALERQLQYPFGFPVIGDSDGKRYEFEIESLNGNEQNAIRLDRRSPLFMVGYQFQKSDLMANTNTLIHFLFAKIVSSFTNPIFLLRSTLYLLPLIIYILWLMVWTKKLNEMPYIPYILIALMVVDIAYIHDVYDGVIYIIIAVWIACIASRTITSRYSFAVAAAGVVLAALAMRLEMTGELQKLSIWIYSMLVIGTVHAIGEEVGHGKSGESTGRDHSGHAQKIKKENSTYLSELDRLPAEYYARYIRTIETYVATKKRKYLDTGCGNGFVI